MNCFPIKKINAAGILLFTVLLSLVSTLTCAGGLTFHHADMLGSTVATSNLKGEITQKYRYMPYGERIDNPPHATNIAYLGKELDSESGLMYFNLRHYDPVIARFNSEDPVLFRDNVVSSYNRYSYSNNNPYSYKDPNGDFAFLALVPVAVAIVEAGLTAYDAYSTYQAIVDPNISKAEAAVVTGAFVAGILMPGGGQAAAVKNADSVISAAEGAVGAIKATDNVAEAAVKQGDEVANNTDNYVDLASDQRRTHILDGDATGGGHRSGTGNPGKSEFPQDWSDDKIMHEISDVATDPSSVTRIGRGGRTITEGTRDGVDIRVIQDGNGDIVSGFPTNSPMNPR